jgi:hypothetical protein
MRRSPHSKTVGDFELAGCGRSDANGAGCNYGCSQRNGEDAGCRAQTALANAAGGDTGLLRGGGGVLCGLSLGGQGKNRHGDNNSKRCNGNWMHGSPL